MKRREALVLQAMLEIEPETKSFLIWQEVSLRYCKVTVTLALQDLASHGLIVRPQKGHAVITEKGRIAAALWVAKRRRSLGKVNHELALLQESA